MTKDYKQKYKTTNWPEYNKALTNRGNLTIWFDSKMQWQAPFKGKRGKPQIFSDAAIQFCLMMKSHFQLPLKQTTGLIQSIIQLSHLAWDTPDFSTICRRQKQIKISLTPIKTNKPIHLLVDSTGIKMLGEGEWKTKKHGKAYRRQWRKLHIGIEAESGQICAVKVTPNNKSDSQILPELLSQLADNVDLSAVYADGAYDTKGCRSAIASRQAVAVIPPRKNAQHWKENSVYAYERNMLLKTIAYTGRTIWKKWSGYHLRSLVETKMFCIKRLGEKLMAKDFNRQTNELLARISVLNKFTELGTPDTQIAS